MARKKPNSHLIYILAGALATLVFGFFSLKSTPSLPCANSLSCEESLTLSVSNGEKAVFGGIEIDPPFIDLAALPEKTNVLGTSESDSQKHIYVDLSTQTLRAMDGDTLFLETKISSGKWAPTPTGDFTIWSKFRATKMSGGQGADYYYLPNVPYVMFFSNSKVAGSRGFSLHGTYWHNNFGHAMSHGCVNMRTIDAEKLFYWTSPDTTQRNSASASDGSGTIITIYGEAP